MAFPEMYFLEISISVSKISHLVDLVVRKNICFSIESPHVTCANNFRQSAARPGRISYVVKLPFPTLGGSDSFQKEMEVNRKQEEKSCNSNSKSFDLSHIDFTKQFTRKNVIDLMKFSLSHENSIRSPLFDYETAWMKEIVELITKIFKLSISAQHVSHTFIETIKNWFLVYLSQSMASEIDWKNKSVSWREDIRATLVECQNEVKMLDLGTEGLEVSINKVLLH